MYTMRATNNGYLHPDFACYVTSFLDFAFSNPNNVGRKIVDDKEVFQIRCPCFKCNNRIYKTRDLVELDIFTSGFMPDYYIWYAHGESYHIPSQPVGQCSIPTPTLSMGQCSNPIPSQHVSQGLNSMGFEHGEFDRYDQMVMDSMQHNNVPQDPNPTAKKFDDMLKDVNVPLWDGCQNHSKLSAATRLLNWKSECNVADSTYDKLLPIIKEMLPDGERLPRNFYETKKMLKLLELPKERIHACKNHCMLFYKEHLHLDHCRVCKAYRFKSYNSKVPNLVLTYMPIGPRLQRLFYSKKTAKHLTWHSDHQREPGKMIHPSDGQAWKHFDKIFPDFAQETRNVRIGLCTDGFSPNNSSSTPYSCWPVFLSIYNLPPWLALKDEYIKIPLLIPGRKSPGQNSFAHFWSYILFRKLLLVVQCNTDGCINMRGSLKRTVRNKAKVEGSIVQSYLVKELATYCSLYFEPTIETRHNREPRNFASDHPIPSSTNARLSVFVFPSRRLFAKGGTQRVMGDQELHKAHTYILLNCVEIHPYVDMFDELAQEEYSNEPNELIESLRDRYFADWFQKHVLMESDGSNNHLKVIARKPSRLVKSHKGYFVKGYKFHTRKHGDGRITNNCGVCVRGTTYNDEESDYFGLLDEVLEVDYLGSERCIVVLFKCTWFDNAHGVKVHQNKLIDIKPKSRLQTNDPFVLASQVEQVYYTPYPAVTRDTKDWWAVIKTKPRGIYEVSEGISKIVDDENMEVEDVFQIDERFGFEYTDEVSNNEPMRLITDGEFEEHEDTNEEEEEEKEEEEEEEEEESQDLEDTEDDEDELDLSDHTFDEDELDS
ncbi:hypothetical protein LXL04_015015 [Taraxacum kok-saghyz]